MVVELVEENPTNVNIPDKGRRLSKTLAILLSIIVVASTVAIAYSVYHGGSQAGGYSVYELTSKNGFVFLKASTILDFMALHQDKLLINQLKDYKGIIISFADIEKYMDNQSRQYIEKFIKEYKDETGGLVFSRIYYVEYKIPVNSTGNTTSTNETKVQTVVIKPLKGVNGVVVLDQTTLKNINKFNLHNMTVVVFTPVEFKNGTVRFAYNLKGVKANYIAVSMTDLYPAYVYGGREQFNQVVSDIVRMAKDDGAKVMFIYSPFIQMMTGNIYYRLSYGELVQTLRLVKEYNTYFAVFDFGMVQYTIGKILFEPKDCYLNEVNGTYTIKCSAERSHTTFPVI